MSFRFVEAGQPGLTKDAFWSNVVQTIDVIVFELERIRSFILGTIPAWVDFDRIDRGGAFFWSTHIIGGIVLGARSFILGYASQAGNKPLVMSGRLESGVTKSRRCGD